MEFEPSEALTDNAHILAQTKKVVLQPPDPFLKPQDTPSPVVAPETHGNVERDTENTADAAHLVQPSPGLKVEPTPSIHHHPVFRMVAIILSVTAGTVIGASYFFLFG